MGLLKGWIKLDRCNNYEILRFILVLDGEGETLHSTDNLIRLESSKGAFALTWLKLFQVLPGLLTRNFLRMVIMLRQGVQLNLVLQVSGHVFQVWSPAFIDYELRRGFLCIHVFVGCHYKKLLLMYAYRFNSAIGENVALQQDTLA